MTDDDLTKLVDKIAAASGYGGLDSSTMYGEFALDVAKAVREECAKTLNEAAAWLLKPKRTNEVDRHVSSILTMHAARIRGA